MWHFHLCVNYIKLFSFKTFLFSILSWRLIVQNQIESLLKICSLVWPLPGLPMEIPVHTYPRISHPEKCYSPSRFILHLKWQRGTLGKRKLSQTDFSFLSSCLEGRVGGLVIQWHVHLPLCKILTHLPLKIFPGVSAFCVDSIYPLHHLYWVEMETALNFRISRQMNILRNNFVNMNHWKSLTSQMASQLLVGIYLVKSAAHAPSFSVSESAKEIAS